MKLRQGAPYQQHGVRVPAEQCISLKAAPGAPALDIELTLERRGRGQGWAACFARPQLAPACGNITPSLLQDLRNVWRAA